MSVVGGEWGGAARPPSSGRHSRSVSWVQLAVWGTRPYVASVFDAGSLVGWQLLIAGVAATAVGMALVSALLVRQTVLFVESGFRAVPATGEDPAGLRLSMTMVLGLTLTVVGSGGIGLALRRAEGRPSATSWLLLLAPAIPLALIAANLLFGLPLPLARLLVRTNAVLVPFGLGWLALGVRLLSQA